VLQIGFGTVEKPGIHGPHRLAFTLTPHLQPINHCGCFSPFVRI
jgi:hypothetical protein